jgi:hypothetical protein
MGTSTARRNRKRIANLSRLAILNPAGFQSRMERTAEDYERNVMRALSEGNARLAAGELAKIDRNFAGANAASLRENVNSRLTKAVCQLTLELLGDPRCAEPFKPLNTLFVVAPTIYESIRREFLKFNAAKIARAMNTRSQTLRPRGQIWLHEKELTRLLADTSNLKGELAKEELFVAASIISETIEASIPAPQHLRKPRRSVRGSGKLQP